MAAICPGEDELIFYFKMKATKWMTCHVDAKVTPVKTNFLKSFFKIMFVAVFVWKLFFF